MRPWRTVESRLALDHPVLKVERALRRRDNGQEHEFVLLHSPDWVNVVPLTAEGRVVLIRQWRQGSQEATLEIPGGLIDPGEGPAQAGGRELREETGYLAGEMVFLGKVNPNPALFSNTCHTFLARDCRLDGDQRLDSTERIEVVTVPVQALPGLVRRGEIVHSLVISALSFFWLAGGGAGGGGLPAAEQSLAPGGELG
jgi:8-oxo-dGTP pyrophosphatase MutT (NUDIX family)